MKLHKIQHSGDEIRFDRYLKKIFPSIKQSSIEEFIRKKKFLMNDIDRKLTSGFRVKNDDIILIHEEIWEQYNYEISSKKIKAQYKPTLQIIDLFKKAIIFENENFLVLNKPVNFSCQGGSNVIHSIDEIMKFIYGEEIRIVHRLDRKTSGILLMGKNLKYAQILTKLFKEKLIKKTYYAICENDIDNLNQEKKKILNFQKVIIDRSMRSKVFSGEEKIVIDDEYGNEAISEVELIKKIDCNLFLLKIKPKTGRKHQIRVHLSSIGFPILGDTKYNDKKSFCKNMFLHAGEIKISEKDLKFQIKCDLPEYFENLLKN
jgi:23S rRNA pseudouridine955/2504/2580 synthase